VPFNSSTQRPTLSVKQQLLVLTSMPLKDFRKSLKLTLDLKEPSRCKY
jgi:hypothetical protein